MLSRSAKTAAQGRAILSPLSPLTSPYAPGYASLSTAAQIAVDNRRRQRVKTVRKVGKVLGAPPRLQISEPTSPKMMSPTTAAAMGFDATIMERLQTVLASPFSPKTFARSILSPALKTPEAPVLPYRPAALRDVKNADKRVGSLKPRRKAPPAMLALPQPARYTEKTPLSPLRYPVVATERSSAAPVPVSPTVLLAHVSPVTKLTEAQIRSQKMEKLSRCLGETVPKELVYPSIGQVTEQAEQVGSYLELYRAGSSVDDSAVGIKSPVPKDAHWENVGLGATKLQRSGSQRSLRRSRSLGDFYSIADIQELQSHNARMAALAAGADVLVQSPLGLMSPTPRPAAKDDPVLKRKRSIANAKAAIIGTDAKLMAQFRLGFGGPALPVPETPLSSPVPSALLAITSPRVPYWVKPTQPKTPRTLRTERRMGWGGAWNVGSMAEMMNQLKEM